MHRLLRSLAMLGVLCVLQSRAQLVETFDQATVPALPRLWSCSAARAPSDFVTSTSLPASPPCCVLATNATVSQWLTWGPLDLQGLRTRRLVFRSRRSASFGAGLLLESSADSMTWVSLGDTLGEEEPSATYHEHSLELQSAGRERLWIRWRVLAAASGSTGTLRLDDVALEVDGLYDLAVSGLTVKPARPGQELVARVEIANRGLLRPDLARLSLGLDLDGDGCVSVQECAGVDLPAPAPGEIRLIEQGAGQAPDHPVLVMASVYVADDRIRGNDSVWATFRPSMPEGSAVFNEIMYAPLAQAPEYVELVLADGAGPLLGGGELTVRALDGQVAHRLTLADSLALDGSYLVIAAEALGETSPAMERGSGLLIWPSLVLRNDGGELVLKDAAGMLCDSLRYEPSWHTPSVVDTRGRSLEKLLPDLPSWDRRNWATCTSLEGGTPGRANAVALSQSGRGAALGCWPNPFSPDGDGEDDRTVISYHFDEAMEAIDLTVHDSRGRLVRHLATRELGGCSGSLVWDGRDDEGETVRMGIYVVAIQARAGQGIMLQAARTPVVVAHHLR